MIDVSTDLVGIVRLGVLAFDELRLAVRNPELDRLLGEAERLVRLRPPDGGNAVRAMYRRVGLDPTKTRPSSEALLRRVSRGEPLPRINPLVDICNWCSLECQLPYGVYDRARIQGAIELRLGRPGEEYPGIRKDVVHLDGRLTLADGLGPFGNPSSDSARTLVSIETTSALVVIFGPKEVGADPVQRALDLTSSRVCSLTGGRETGRRATN